MLLSTLQLSVLLGTAFGGMGEWDDDFTFSTYLEENHQFRLYWSLLDDDVIEIGIEANTTGWIAMGLSPNGGMQNSDFMLGWVDDSDGTVVLQDRYTGDWEGRPSLDDEDHLTLIEGEQVDGVTRIKFQRTKTLDCDDDSGHDMAVTQGTSRVIYAWHDDDGDADDADSISYHGYTQRGSDSVNMWYGQDDVVELEDDVEYFDLTMTNWSVASDETEYVCKIFELPEFDDKQHVVMIEPMIESENEGTVHHILLYTCSSDRINGTIADHHQNTCDEWDTNMPSEDCRDGALQAAWAIGGGPFYWPEVAGLPFSGDSSFNYAFMEVHYDNPEYRDDIVDSSGFRLWYTPTLREYDSGILFLGISVIPYFQFTPPGLVSTLTGYCSSDCSEQGLPDDGVQAFASFLHAHNVGSALKLRHVRDGVELEPMEVNENYDFNYQQIMAFTEEITIMPGDQFIMECEYDTTTRDGMTLAGLGSSQEMCVSFLFVYPVPEMYFCVTTPDEDAVLDWLDDSFDAGFWEAEYEYDNETTLTVQDLLDAETIERASEVHPMFWETYGGYWNEDMDGAQEMYDALWNNETYNGRFKWCYNQDGTEFSDLAASTFDEEFGDFTEYCTDSCTCESAEESMEEDVDDDTLITVGVVIGVVLVVIVFASVIFLMMRNKRMSASVSTTKADHVPHTSTASGMETETR